MATKANILVLTGCPSVGVDMLKAEHNVNVWPYEMSVTEEALYAKAAGAHALLISSDMKIDARLLDVAGPQLKVIRTMSAGLDHIDIPECQKRNVLVGNTSNVQKEAVADVAIGLLLCTSRRFKEGFSVFTIGDWYADDFFGQEVHVSTVGIAGPGRIGLSVAKIFTGFGAKWFLYNGNTQKSHDTEVGAEFVSFDDLLKKADFVIACCSLNKENKEIFDKHAFSKMKQSAIFINIARGALLNQDDLHEALTSGQIYAAGLAVTTPEPIPQDSLLLKLYNCIITSHVGSSTLHTVNQMAVLSARNMLAGLNGEQLPSPVY